MCRILIVEDNVDAAESLRLLLQLTGHTVTTAQNGPEAVEKAPDFEPDVVLCDIGLPEGMDGYAVARTLRNLPKTENVYLIAFTGHGCDQDREMSTLSGFDLHLTKPVDPAMLRRLLASPLEHRNGASAYGDGGLAHVLH